MDALPVSADLPLVTVIIPCRNEASAIEPALEAIGCQDYPLQLVEVVVVDGGSDDATALRAKEILSQLDVRRSDVLFNEAGTTPSNLNCGLRWAHGDIIVRVDARSRIPKHYVRTVVDRMWADATVAVVGGSQVSLVPEDTPRGRAIARALNNRFGMGLSRYRRHGSPSGLVDTVYLGAFRTRQLVSVGGWNEAMTTNQDFELNQRMRQVGSVWFEADLPVGYVPRRTVGELWHQYRRFGRAKVAYWHRTGSTPNGRQLFLLCAPPVVAGASVAGFAALGVIGRCVLASGLLASILGIDRLGSDRKADSLLESGTAAAVSAVVGIGWWSGVIHGLVGGKQEEGTTR